MTGDQRRGPFYQRRLTNRCELPLLQDVRDDKKERKNPLYANLPTSVRKLRFEAGKHTRDQKRREFKYRQQAARGLIGPATASQMPGTPAFLPGS